MNDERKKTIVNESDAADILRRAGSRNATRRTVRWLMQQPAAPVRRDMKVDLAELAKYLRQRTGNASKGIAAVAKMFDRIVPAGAKPRAMSTGERVAKFVAEHNEITQIPEVRHKRARESCRYDLARFGWLYCRQVLDHRPSRLVKERLVDKIQECIISGGQLDVMCSRGLGKTTWLEIGTVWACLYGHRTYPVVIAATAQLARNILKTVWKIIESSDAIAKDFPAVSLPIRQLKGVAQRAMSQTYCGRPTGISTGQDHFKFPMLTHDNGAKLEEGCGAVMGAVGIGGSVRGLLDMGRRPDLILFDDPQTKKDAASATRVTWIESFIHQDALGLAAHTGSVAAFVAITPQRYGDVAGKLCSKAEHPEWSVTRQPFIERWSEQAENLIPEFVERYREDAARDDFTKQGSRDWYREHAEGFKGTLVADPMGYDKKLEFDAVHHALNLRARVGEDSWLSEYMLDVSEVTGEMTVTAEMVSNAVNGAAEWNLPPGTSSAVGFCDVNIKKGTGLSWGVVAFGPSRVAAVIAYGRYPKVGALVPVGASDLVKSRAVARAIREVVTIMAKADIRTADRRKVNLRAVGFDRGYLPAVVCRTLFVLRKRLPLPFQLCATRGLGWRQFGGGQKNILSRGDHLFATRSEYGEYLAVHAPYWREVAQSGFMETPLMPGSCSMFGTDPVRHVEFGNEIAAERLLRKYVVPGGDKIAWDWVETGANHYCDVLTGCFALASWFRLYDALPQAIDAHASGRMNKPTRNADLFDPRLNPSIAQNTDGWAPFDDQYATTQGGLVARRVNTVEKGKSKLSTANQKHVYNKAKRKVVYR